MTKGISPMRMTARLPTARPGPLMATAAKHFAHKVAVQADESGARVAFPTGLGVMTVEDGALALVIEAEDGAAAESVRAVLEGHLLRFAHREAPEPLIWAED